MKGTFILADIPLLWVIENRRFPTPQIQPLVRAFGEEENIKRTFVRFSTFPLSKLGISYANGLPDYLRWLSLVSGITTVMQLGAELPFNVCTSVSSPTTHEPETQQIPTPARVFVVLRAFYKVEASNHLTGAHSLLVCTSECLLIALGH